MQPRPDPLDRPQDRSTLGAHPSKARAGLPASGRAQALRRHPGGGDLRRGGRRTIDLLCHYAGKDDLKRRGLDHLGREIAAAVSANAPPFAFAKPLFEHARAHREHIGALAGGRGDEVARTRLREIITANVRRDLGARSRGTRGDFAPQVAVAVSAFIGLLDWWLEEGHDRSAEEMAALFQKTATSSLIG